MTNPPLRFKQDDGSDFPDWILYNFSTLFKTLSTKLHQIKNIDYCKYGDYPIVDQGKEFIAGYSDNSDLLFKNLPIIVFGDHTTVLKYIDFPFIVGADGTKLLCNNNNDLELFLYYLLLYYLPRQDGYRRHFSMLIGKRFLIPKIQEQQKIADFLMAVDEGVKLSEENVEIAKKYKKWLLQNLFPKKDQTNPPLRFKQDDGSDFPDWQIKSLGSLFKISAGGDISKTNVRRFPDTDFIYPIYSNSESKNGLFGYSNIYKQDSDALTVTGRGTIGIAKVRYQSFYPIVRLLVLRPVKDAALHFFEELINHNGFFIESTSVSQLTAPQISSYKFRIPVLQEQQKIADFLLAVDDIIKLREQIVELKKKYKKSLLQRMFV